MPGLTDRSKEKENCNSGIASRSWDIRCRDVDVFSDNYKGNRQVDHCRLGDVVFLRVLVFAGPVRARMKVDSRGMTGGLCVEIRGDR